METQLGTEYVLEDEIGRGMTGTVYRGWERASAQPIAAKVLRPELVSDNRVVADFVAQVSYLSSIDDPHVVRIIDLVVDSGKVAIVMEFVQGPDLGSYLRTRAPLPPGLVVRFGSELLAAVAAVHAAGIMHLDIKPANALIDQSSAVERLKLTDFGIARLAPNEKFSKLSGQLGTPEYMAPEVASGQGVSAAADLYSAGIVLYEMLCGRTPFAGRPSPAVVTAHIGEIPPPIPGAPERLWALIESLLSKDPAARPQSASAVSRDLAALEPSLAGLAPLQPMPAPSLVGAPSMQWAAGPGSPVSYPGSEPPRGPAAETKYSHGRLHDVIDHGGGPPPIRSNDQKPNRQKGLGQAIGKVFANRIAVAILAAVLAGATATSITLLNGHSETITVPEPVFVYPVANKCAGGTTCVVNTRVGPGTSFSIAKQQLDGGKQVEIICQVKGQQVAGPNGKPGSSIWDKLVQGDYVSDLYVLTPGHNGKFSSPIPRCK